MSGAEIKKVILSAGLKLWQVANALNMQDYSFSRKLRYDFNEEDTQKVLSVIEDLKKA